MTAAIALGATLSLTAASSAAAVEDLPPLVYAPQNFDAFDWEVARNEPHQFNPAGATLDIAVDRNDRHPNSYNWQEGMVTDLPLTVDGDREVVSVRATVFVDPAWADLDKSEDRQGDQTAFEAGMWLSVPYHPNYGDQSAWPTILLRNDHSAEGNVPVASVFDTTNREDENINLGVSYGDYVTLEMRYDRETYSYYYLANDQLIFEHQWWDLENSGFPLESLYFFTYNSGEADLPEGEPDLFEVQWSNLEFGYEALPATINDESVPDGTVGTAYSHAFDIDSDVEPFTATAEDLPDGLELSADGVLTGTPRVSGIYTFTVSVDNGVDVVFEEFTIEIAEGAFEGDIDYDFELDESEPTVGGTVSLSQFGQLTPAPDSVTFQWFRDGVFIEGVTSDSYTFTADDVGSTVHAVVTLSSEGYEDVIVVVDGLSPVAEATPEAEPTEPAPEPTEPAALEQTAPATGATEQDDLPATGAPFGLLIAGLAALILVVTGGAIRTRMAQR